MHHTESMKQNFESVLSLKNYIYLFLFQKSQLTPLKIVSEMEKEKLIWAFSNVLFWCSALFLILYHFVCLRGKFEIVKKFFCSPHNAAIIQALYRTYCILPSADKPYGDSDFIFQVDLAPAHTADMRGWKESSVTIDLLFDWPATNSPDFNLMENRWAVTMRDIRHADHLEAAVNSSSCSIIAVIHGKEANQVLEMNIFWWYSNFLKCTWYVCSALIQLYFVGDRSELQAVQSKALLQSSHAFEKAAECNFRSHCSFMSCVCWP